MKTLQLTDNEADSLETVLRRAIGIGEVKDDEEEDIDSVLEKIVDAE
jgi:hypothetical protein